MLDKIKLEKELKQSSLVSSYSEFAAIEGVNTNIEFIDLILM